MSSTTQRVIVLLLRTCVWLSKPPSSKCVRTAAAVCAAVCIWSRCSLKTTKYFNAFCPGVVFVSVSPPVYLLCFAPSSALVFHLAVLFRCFVEPVVMWRPEDAHHPGCPGRADQRCDHPPLGLGHLPAHTGGSQAAPTLLPGPPQRHWLSPVSVTVCVSKFIELQWSQQINYVTSHFADMFCPWLWMLKAFTEFFYYYIRKFSQKIWPLTSSTFLNRFTPFKYRIFISIGNQPLLFF